MLSTRTLSKFPKFTIEELYKAQEAAAFNDFRAVLKCSPEAYIALKDFLVDEEQERRIHQAVKAGNIKNHVKSWGTLFGIEIKLDPDLLPGEWKFE